ncbi:MULTISPECIES: tryptophan transporter [Oceanobacillus]|uniref:Tryptophan transport protein n=1 Tax=Oceanobacillus indicireducens TaxID=1004261 RepID=A0A918D344_9BACI|nr:MULTISPECIES: tryptophan transporter [Oceanobacillus]GGN60635.1 putative tryptophan transport protein [Oceanobacillus indicireducens]
MKVKVLVILSLLVGIGAVLHAIIPPLFFGVKPDMLLSMMFLGIFLFPKPKYVLVLSLATGIMSALTTGAPGGQIANVIDKPITAFLVLAIFLALKGRLNENITAPALAGIGTLISGSIFITVISLIAGIPEGGLISLFLLVVLPAMAVNAVIMVVVYPIVQGIFRRSNPISVS